MEEEEELQRRNSFPDLDDDDDFLPPIDPQRLAILRSHSSSCNRSFGRLENHLKKPELTCISEEVKDFSSFRHKSVWAT